MQIFRKLHLGDKQKEDLQNLITPSSKEGLSLFRIIFSTLLCCVGINFNQEWTVILAMILYPIVDLLIGFVNSLMRNDIKQMTDSLVKIVITILVSIIVALIYYTVTPFSIYTQEIFSLSRLSISVFFAEILLGIMLCKVILTDFYSITRALLGVISSILLLLCIVGMSVKYGDFPMMLNSLKYLFLSLFFILIGLVISFSIFKISNREDTSTIIPKITLGILTILGIYFGAKEIYAQTTNFNVEQYVYKELENRNFSVSNIEVNKASKEVIVYYSGIKPAIAQDRALKKKYKLKNYHFVFEEIR